MKRQHLASLSFLGAKVSLELNLLGMEGAHLLAKTKIWLVFFFYILTLTSKCQKFKVKELYLELSVDQHEHDPHVQSNM
jgi:hypothetical protein